MLKKYILSFAFCTALLAPVAPVQANVLGQQQEASEVVAQPAEQSEEDATIEAATVANDESSAELSRKEKQQAKAENAQKNDSHGFAITIIAMCIVLAALIVLSLLFLGFGFAFAKILTRRKKQAHGVDDHSAQEHHEEPDSGEAIAAIGMALAEHFGQGHDMEDTILTIKRMRKAYSPWNSKIYNLRQVPEHGPANTSARRPLK